ncbi:MAG: sterol desaturase family protein [Pseudomonadota bacterium]
MSESKVEAGVMSPQVQARADHSEGAAPLTGRDWLWALPQPVLVLGSMLLVGMMVAGDWVYRELFAAIMIILPIPLVLIAERLWTKRNDWLLEPKELAEDSFWLAFAGLLWIPLYSDFYETPVSEGIRALRDTAPLQITLEPDSFLGLVGSALLVMFTSSFFYYWLHRGQHESLFWWRIHATHHHITKMGCLRGDRTHPLEYLALAVGPPIALALLGASDSVMAVAGAFGIWNGTLNHSNLPLRSMPVYNWFFATAEQHHAHHALALDQSNSNYGCNIIFWDRVFGTYCGDTEVGQIGAGKAVPLSIKTQLALPFYSSERLVDL